MTYQEDDSYKLATPQEQVFFDRYVQDKNLLAAVKLAYRTSSDEAARDYGLKILKRTRIAYLLATYFPPKRFTNLPTIEDLRIRYMEIADSESATMRERLQALVAYERVSGFSKPKKAVEEGFDILDDIAGSSCQKDTASTIKLRVIFVQKGTILALLAVRKIKPANNVGVKRQSVCDLNACMI